MYQPTQKPDWLHRIGIGVIVLAILAVIGAIIKPAAQTHETAEQSGRARVERQMSAGPSGKLLKERFPEEFAALLDRNVTNERDPNLTRQQKDRLIEQGNRDVRTRNGDHAYFAQPTVLLKVLQHLQDDTQLVLNEYGAKVCARYLNEGVDVLPWMTAKVTTSHARLGELNMLAMAEGRDDPAARTEATEVDMASLQTAVADTGMNMAELDATATGRSVDNACANSLVILQTAIDLPGEAGDRVRAQLVWSMAKP
jgi:hypothetical protein